MVSGGQKVGWSTDMDAAVFADALTLDRVFKVSNVDYIYDKDPKEFFDAKPIKDMTWKSILRCFQYLLMMRIFPMIIFLLMQNVQYSVKRRISHFM